MTGLTSIVRGPSVSPALLELEHSPLNSLPRNRVPSIHRLSSNRAHSLSTPTDTSIFQVIVSASAYPVAFPRAFASETIPPSSGMRWTPTLHFPPESPDGGYFVPDDLLPLPVGRDSPPGFCGVEHGSIRQSPGLYPLPCWPSLLPPSTAGLY
jgi:hypothetical protein